MLDKKNTSIQDRGWNDMHSILDKELPVKQKNRKRGLWFLFGSAAIVTSGLVALLAFPGLNEGSNIVDMAEANDSEKFTLSNGKAKVDRESEIAADDNSITEFNDQNDLNKSTLLNNIPNEEFDEYDNIRIIDQSSHTKNFKKEIPLDSDIKFIKTKNSSKLIEKTIVQNQPHELLAVSEISSYNPFSETSTEQSETSNIITGAELINVLENNTLERNKVTPIFRLPLHLPSLPNTEKLEIERIKPIISTKSRNSFSPYLFASANYQTEFNGFGYGMGAGLNYGNTDLEVYFESSYLKSRYNKRVTLDDKSIPIADVIEEIENSGNTIGFNTPNGVNFLTFSELTTGTDELRLGLGIRKKVSKKLKMDIGVTYSKLLKASNKSLNININPTANMPEGSAYNIGSTELFDSGVYAEYDIVPHLGIEYALSSEIFCNLHFNYGIKNLIADKDLDESSDLRYVIRSSSTSGLSVSDKIYRRSIGIKIRYEF